MKKIIIHGKFKADGIPMYSSAFASGADLRADLKEDVKLQSGQRAIIPTGVFLDIPDGFEAQVRPRSGLAAKHGITVLNTPGTIDSDYRGEIKIILINLGEETYTVKNGSRIAQIVFAPVIQAEFIPGKNLTVSRRGEGGFGSTGIM
ncbi:MAG: dUTP diphosphatase [Spirochaetes bacterium]|nr:MAG: dUTP diphosphatase [Spirochaetota bacterium]